MRVILERVIDGQRLVGTYHVPTQIGTNNPPRYGVILFNSGFLPRAPIGDLLVRLADHFASLGYPSFRFDLPGLGDSEGELPADTQNFFAGMTRGVYGRASGLLAKALTAEYELDGMIFGGLCGGAVTSLFAAGAEGAEVCRGILQIDPAFGLVPPLDTSTRPVAARVRPARRGLAQRYQSARIAFLKTRSGENVHAAYRKVKPAIVWLPKLIQKARGPKMPPNANLPMIRIWIDLIRRGKPILVFMAGDREKRTEKFDYFAYLERVTSRPTEVEWVEDTTHAFVEGNGIPAIKAATTAWLARNFDIGNR